MSETIGETQSAVDSRGELTTAGRVVDRFLIAAAFVFGAGSIALFAVADAIPAIRLDLPTAHPLWWDAALSLLFFVQHSGMVRRGFQKRLAAFVAKRYHGAVYSIVSGIVLTAVAVLWLPVRPPLLVMTGAALWTTRLLAISAAALFVGTLISSSHDMLGIKPIRRHLRGRPEPPSRFFATGAYSVVRHPFYACVIVLLWCAPVLTPDRLLLNVLWTAWIVAATFLEERDLIADFGNTYRDYRRRVPMFVPWRGRVRLDEDEAGAGMGGA